MEFLFLILSFSLLIQNTAVGEELEDFFGVEEKEPPVVKTDYGAVRGTWEESTNGRKYASFEGIPYAKPPVGELRFQAPQPAEPWSGTFNASGTQEFCLQYDPFFEEVTGTEDCLFINVYSPRLQPLAGLPVLVFVHGGAFFYGAGYYYNPVNIMDWDMVVVTFNYRLGPLGFLSTGDDVVPGNAGLKDQALALKWVKDNVMWFGGDPHSITLAGSSSGAASVHYHYLSKMSKGTFHRGIAWSGSALLPWVYTTKPLEKARQLASLLDCPTNTTRAMVDCMLNLQGNEVVSAFFYQFPWKVHMFSPFTPTTEAEGVEGAFLTQHPFEATSTGGMLDLPLLVSVTTEEGLYPAAAYQKNPEEFLPEIEEKWNELAPDMFNYKDTLLPNMMSSVAAKIKARYLKNKPVSLETYGQLVQAMGDRNFVSGVGKMAQYHALTASSPVHLYEYAFRGDRSFSFALSWNYKNFGVSHADDLFHIFLVPLISSNAPDDVKMTKVLIDLIYTYAKGEQPSLPNAPKWLPLQKGQRALNYMRIENHTTFVMKTSSDFGHRSFWDGLGFNEDQNYRKNRTFVKLN